MTIRPQARKDYRSTARGLILRSEQEVFHRRYCPRPVALWRRYFYPVPEVGPKSILMVIRSATIEDAPAIARVHIDSWRTTYDGLLPDKVLAELSLTKRQATWQQRIAAEAKDASSGFVLVAEASGGNVVGFASGGPNRERDSAYGGELYAVYVLKEYQRKGVGRRITRRVVARLRASGHSSMAVWVLEGNPAAAFYRRLGGHQAGEKIVGIGGDEYLEIAYGWKNLEEFGKSST